HRQRRLGHRRLLPAGCRDRHGGTGDAARHHRFPRRAPHPRAFRRLAPFHRQRRGAVAVALELVAAPRAGRGGGTADRAGAVRHRRAAPALYRLAWLGDGLPAPGRGQRPALIRGRARAFHMVFFGKLPASLACPQVSKRSRACASTGVWSAATSTTRRSATRPRGSRRARAGRTCRRTGPARTAAAPSPTSNRCRSRPMADPVCILGHGVAALALLREYRRLAPSAPVLVLSDTDGNYCYKPRLTAAFSRGLLPSELVTEAAMSWTARLDARLLCPPEAPVVDTRRRTLRVGADTIRYRALVLAVGAQGRVPELAEACVPLLRIDTWQEWRHAHPQLSRAQHVAVVGAGLVGCELADDLARAGKEVELVDNGPWPLHGKVPAEIGTLLARTLSHYGTHFHRQRRLHALRSARAGHLRLDLGDG